MLEALSARRGALQTVSGRRRPLPLPAAAREGPAERQIKRARARSLQVRRASRGGGGGQLAAREQQVAAGRAADAADASRVQFGPASRCQKWQRLARFREGKLRRAASIYRARARAESKNCASVRESETPPSKLSRASQVCLRPGSGVCQRRRLSTRRWTRELGSGPLGSSERASASRAGSAHELARGGQFDNRLSGVVHRPPPAPLLAA